MFNWLWGTENNQSNNNQNNNNQNNNSNTSTEEQYKFEARGHKSTQKLKNGFISSFLKLVSSPPTIISILSFQHIVLKLPLFYLYICTGIIFICNILNYYIVSQIKPKHDTYGSVAGFLFFIPDSFTIIVKSMVCLFFVDMLMESINQLVGFKIGSLDIVYLFCFVLFFGILLSIFFVVIRVYELFNLLYLFIILCGIGLLFIMKLSSTSISNGISSEILTNQIVTFLPLIEIIFIVFAVCSFSQDCLSTSVSICMTTYSNTFLISIVGYTTVALISACIFYITKNLINIKLADIIKLMTNYTKLSYIFIIMYSLLGFILNINLITDIIENMITSNDVISTTIGTILLLCIICITIWNKAGFFLWWSIFVVFVGFPIYFMLPYICYLFCKSNWFMFFCCFVFILGFLSLFGIGVYYSDVLNPINFPSL